MMISLEIHANIFNDSTGLDPAGNPVSSVTGISVDLMEKVGFWTQVDPEMEHFGDFAGTYSCRWTVLIHFNLQGFSRFELNHDVILLARPVTVGEDSGWELVGIVPRTYSATNKTESIGWDEVLALYR